MKNWQVTPGATFYFLATLNLWSNPSEKNYLYLNVLNHGVIVNFQSKIFRSYNMQGVGYFMFLFELAL